MCCVRTTIDTRERSSAAMAGVGGIKGAGAHCAGALGGPCCRGRTRLFHVGHVAGGPERVRFVAVRVAGVGVHLCITIHPLA